MKKLLKISALIVLLQLSFTIQANAQSKDISLTIHLRGVYSSKITLLALTDNKLFKPFKEVPVVNNGETTKITIPQDHLPGEFVLRFDYKEKESSTPYPSEKNIYAYEQNLELWVSPKYCNNGDSTRFQSGEKENSAFVSFSKENSKKKEKLGYNSSAIHWDLINTEDKKVTAKLKNGTAVTIYEKGQFKY